MPSKPKPDRWIAVYLRASSKTQGLESQRPDMDRWAAAQELSTRHYSDVASGSTMERPDWGRLWRDVLAGHVATVACWRLDRLGRTAKGLTALFDELRQRKVNLYSHRDGLDLATPAGRLMANVLASVAQYETEVRSERQMAGIAEAKAQGVRFGRPGAGGRAKRIKVRPEQEAAVLRLVGEGRGKAEVARTVGLSRPTVYAILGAAGPGAATPSANGPSAAVPTPADPAPEGHALGEMR